MLLSVDGGAKGFRPAARISSEAKVRVEETTRWKAVAVAHSEARRDSDQPGSGSVTYGLAAEPDHVLTALVADGSTAAFSVLVTRHADRHLAFAERIMGVREEAEDALQDAFARLWTHAGRFQPERAKFTTWFYRIVFNQCLDRKRKRQHVALPDGFDAVDDRDGPDGELGQKQRENVVKAALLDLPENQRAAVTLCYFEGISNREAAEILEVNIKALESLLTRARKKLKTMLAGQMDHLLERE